MQNNIIPAQLHLILLSDWFDLMGVFKLWELLLTIAQPYNIEQLNGKVIAIDASIWIVKIDSIFNSNNEKIKSILSKVMMLKRNNILPIFVFDGVPPALKRRTLEERSKRRLVANDQQAKKISEIEIMRMIQGDTKRTSEKSRKLQQNELQLNQINTRIQRLSEFSEKSEQQISKQFIQKIALQSQILNTKYQIMLDLIPQYRKYENYLDISQYIELDLQSKIQYLNELEQFKWKDLKKYRKINKKEFQTQQQKLIHDIQVIEKKSIIRQMQDNLFRKMMQKNMKIQNGFEIIQTIYNGKKVVQKRRVKQEQSSNSFGFNFKKQKMKNNLAQISFASQKQSDPQGGELDPFVSSFCNHSSKVNNEKQSNSNISQSIKLDESTNLSTNYLKDKKLTIKQTNRNSDKFNQKRQQKKKNQLVAQSYQQNQSQELHIPFINHTSKEQHPQKYVNQQQFIQKYNHSQEQAMNRDNLPNFKSEQNTQYLNASNNNIELQNLFTILGLPFLVASGEAEAQCALLEQQGIVDGIVTEDSDIFLFGGQNVYRGVFNNNIRYYSQAKIQQKLKLTREKLIIFAELLGSDYTEGVKGIGLVNAMEILKVFNTFDKLQKFKNWAQHPDALLPDEQTTNQLLKFANQQQKQFYELHKKFKNYWYIGQSFGNKTVHEAYLKPDVVRGQQLKQLKQKGIFNQKQVKLPLLTKLLKQKLQLQDKQFDHYMRLLTSKYNNKRPNTLLNYFQRIKPEQSNQYARIKSKRLQKSIENITKNDQ